MRYRIIHILVVIIFLVMLNDVNVFKVDGTLKDTSIPGLAGALEVIGNGAVVRSSPEADRTPNAGGTPKAAADENDRAAYYTGEWVLTWSDEFDGTGAPDPDKWDMPSYNRRNNPNGPDGYWDADQVYLDGAGNCVIRIERVENRNQDNDPCDYAMGAMRTYNKFSQTYGRFECRVRLPQRQGWWVAFWLMLGDVGSIGNGGVDGAEIDVVEAFGWNDTVNHAVHWDGYGDDHRSEGHSESIADIRNGWHTYTLDWKPDSYIFYVDGVERWRTAGGGVCNQPGYIKLTGELPNEEWALTDVWAKDPADAVYPDHFMIDCVRVYRDASN